VSSERKSPSEIVRAIMRELSPDEPKTVQEIAKAIGSGWETTWRYLNLIEWIQKCPKVVRIRLGKRLEVWRREWGKIPT